MPIYLYKIIILTIIIIIAFLNVKNDSMYLLVIIIFIILIDNTNTKTLCTKFELGINDRMITINNIDISHFSKVNTKKVKF